MVITKSVPGLQRLTGLQTRSRRTAVQQHHMCSRKGLGHQSWGFMASEAAEVRTDLCQGDIGSASRHTIGNVVHDGFRKQHWLLAHNRHLQHVHQ